MNNAVGYTERDKIGMGVGHYIVTAGKRNDERKAISSPFTALTFPVQSNPSLPLSPSLCMNAA